MSVMRSRLGSHLFVVVTFQQYYICVQLHVHLHMKPCYISSLVITIKLPV